MRKLGQTPNDTEKIQEALENADPASIDSNEATSEVSELQANTVSEVEPTGEPAQEQGQEEDRQPAFPDINNDQGMTLHPREFYEKQEDFVPAIEVQGRKTYAPTETKGQFKEPARQVREKKFRDHTEKVDHFTKEMAKPASEQDLSNIDESVVLDLPQLKAASFEVIDILNLKPKNKSIRFKWANYKNNVAGNLGRLTSLGFTTASPDDVDLTRTPVDNSMVDGTTIKYYDVILLKIPVLRLMALYKANMLRSINRMAQTTQKGLKEAKRQFSADLEGTGQQNAYNHYKEVLEKEPVEFYIADGG